MPSVARVTRCTTVRGDHESVSRCNVMRQQKTRWTVEAGQDSCNKRLQVMQSQTAVVAPPAGLSPLPSWARGPLSVPCRRDTHSYCSKTGPIWSSATSAIRGGAAGPHGPGSYLTGPGPVPRSGMGSVTPRVPRGGEAPNRRPGARTPRRGPGPPHACPDLPGA